MAPYLGDPSGRLSSVLRTPRSGSDTLPEDFLTGHSPFGPRRASCGPCSRSSSALPPVRVIQPHCLAASGRSHPLPPAAGRCVRVRLSRSSLPSHTRPHPPPAGSNDAERVVVAGPPVDDADMIRSRIRGCTSRPGNACPGPGQARRRPAEHIAERRRPAASQAGRPARTGYGPPRRARGAGHCEPRPRPRPSLSA